MADQSDTPIVVPASPAGDQLKAAFRSLLVAAGAYGAGKGWFPPDMVGSVITIIMILGPMIWSQIKVRSTHADLITAAEAAPDRVAQVQKPT